MTKLKPCPFCGGQVTIANYGDYLSIITKGTDPKVSCRCRLFMESEKFEEGDKEDRRRAEESLVDKWNRRFDGWHTGTPTENGLYVVVIKVTDTLYYHRLSNWYKGVGFVVEREGSKVHSWQKIEPYKEENNGRHFN